MINLLERQKVAMGKVSVKDISSCEKVLTVNVAPADVQKEYDHVYEHLGKHAKVPGFRPGKAPKDVLVLHYKNEATEKVVSNLISSSLHEALKSKEIFPIGSPVVQKVKFEKEELSYEALIDVKPKIKLGKYKGVEAKQKPALVEESEINDVLKRIQETHVRLVPVTDRAAQIGDLLSCDYTLTVEGKEAERREEDVVELREKDYFEGFSNQLIGVKAGETREVKVKFPEQFAKKEWVGKEGIYKIAVKEIKTKQLPELNDDLAKEAGEFDTLDALRKKIREEFTAKKKREVEEETKDQLLKEVIKHSKFDIPKRLVESRLDSLVKKGVETLKSEGMNEESAQKKKDELREKLRDAAERDVRLSFILHEVSTHEKIQAAPEDFKARYAAISEWVRQPLEEVEKYYESHEEQKESLEIQIVNEKAVQFIRDQANIKIVS